MLQIDEHGAVTRKVHLSESQASRAGFGPKKKTSASSDAPTRPGDAEYILPSAWSLCPEAIHPCGACLGLFDIVMREIERVKDDGIWRCQGCFEARRRKLRRYGPTPRGVDCHGGRDGAG